MISFTVRMKFASDDVEEITQTLEALARMSRQEPGCVTYVPHWVESDPDTVLIYEQYKDEAAVEAHRASAHFKQHAIGGLYQKMLERSMETLSAIA